MMQPSKTALRTRSGTTLAGTFGTAVVSVLLLCGAGNTPTGNIQTGDVNANGHAITNAANVATTNLNVSTMAALPSNTTVGGTNFGTVAATAAAAGSVDPRTMNLNGCAFVFEGDSITYGYNLSSPTTQCFGCLASQMPFFKNHGTYYNDAVSGSTIATGTSGGNNITDRYVADVKPHRPTANGGDGGPRAYLFLMIGTNDLNNLGDTGAQVISALNTYIATAQGDGFTVILSPITPRTSFTAGSTIEGYREQVNAAIRLGANATSSSSTVVPSNGVLDYASTLSDASNTAYYGDGLHPTALGHQLIANYINAAMTAGGSQLVPMPNYFGEQLTYIQPITLTGGILGSFYDIDSSLPALHTYTALSGGTGGDFGYAVSGIGSIPSSSVFVNTNQTGQSIALTINLVPKFTVSNTAITSTVPISSPSANGSTSISATGTTTLSASGPVNSNALTFGAGSGAYTASIVLSDSGVQAGQVYEVYISLPASTNPTVNIYDASTGGTLLATPTINGVAGTTTLQFVNSGTAWAIYNKGALLKYQNLADLQSASTARTNLAVPGLASNNAFTGTQTITNTTSPQLTLAYDGTHFDTFSVASTGALSIVSNPTAQQITLAGANGNGFTVTPQFGLMTLLGTTVSDNGNHAGFDGLHLIIGTTGSVQFTNGSTFTGSVDTQLSRPSANTLSVDTTTAGNGSGSIIDAGETIGGGTKVKEIKIGTGTLSSGGASLSDAAISSTSAIIVTHLGSSATNAGALLVYPTGSGAGTVTSANSSDNDTFTYIVVNH